MSEFTKGKWSIDRDGSAIFSDSEDCYVAELSPANSDEQVVANARLIAAAPEMYELLKICAKTEEPASYIPAFLDLKDKARELLARIDGKETHS